MADPQRHPLESSRRRRLRHQPPRQPPARDVGQLLHDALPAQDQYGKHSSGGSQPSSGGLVALDAAEAGGRMDQAGAGRDQSLQPTRHRPVQQFGEHRCVAADPGRKTLGGQRPPQPRQYRQLRTDRNLRDGAQPRQDHQHRFRVRLCAGQRRPPARGRLPERPLYPPRQ